MKNPLVAQGFPVSLWSQLKQHCPQWFPSSYLPLGELEGWGWGWPGHKTGFCHHSDSQGLGSVPENKIRQWEDQRVFYLLCPVFLPLPQPTPIRVEEFCWWSSVRCKFLLEGTGTCSPGRAKGLHQNFYRSRTPASFFVIAPSCLWQSRPSCHSCWPTHFPLMRAILTILYQSANAFRAVDTCVVPGLFHSSTFIPSSALVWKSKCSITDHRCYGNAPKSIQDSEVFGC